MRIPDKEPRGKDSREPIAKADANAVDQHAAEHLDVFLYLRVLLAHWWIIIPLTIVGAAAGYFIWMSTPPVYKATCQLEIMPNFKWGTEMDLLSRSYQRQFLGRHMVLLQSKKLHQAVSSQLAPIWEPKRPDGGRNPVLKMMPVGEASQAMLRMTVESFSPTYSEEYLRLLLEEFARFRYEEAATVSESTLGGLRAEQANYAQQLQEANDAIVEFESKHDLLFEEQKNESHKTLLASLISQRARIASQRRMIEHQFEFLKADTSAATLNEVLSLVLQNSQLGGGIAPMRDAGGQQSGGGSNQSNPIVISTAHTSATGIPESEFAEWRASETNIKRLKSEYEYLLRTFKPMHPRLLDLQERINQSERELRISAELTLKRLHSRYEALQLQEDSLQAAAEELRSIFQPNTSLRAQYTQLLDKADQASSQYQVINRRIVDLRSSAVDKALTHVVEDPYASSRPIWPIKWKIMSSSTTAGALAGVALVLLIFFLKSRLYDFDGLERALGITCLGGIQKLSAGRMKKIGGASMVVSRERNSIISESFRNVRTNIEHAMGEDGKILLLTSPDPAEGKTLLALNAATVFSWNHDRVLIIDGDFRKLSLRKAFPGSGSKGVTDLLTDPTLKIEDCIVKAPHPELAPNLDYLPAGHRKDTTTELLTTSATSDLFERLRELYDFVVIDSAPANRVVDTILLSNHADAVLLVARAGRTTVPALRYCYSRISANNVIGYLINGMERSSSRYSYYYSSGYYGQARYYYHSYAYKGYYGSTSNKDSSAEAEG